MMTTQEAKQYLNGYRDVGRVIQRLTERRSRLSALLTDVSPKSDVGSSNGVRTDRVGEIVSALVDLDAEIDAQFVYKAKIGKEIVDIIDMIDDAPIRRILYLRYLACATYDAIARDVGYSRRHVLRLHGTALQTVAQLLSKMSL